MNPHPTPGIPLHEGLRMRLAAFVSKHGEKPACAVLQVSRPALLRALAGVGVRRGTALLIEVGLQRIAAEAPPETTP